MAISIIGYFDNQGSETGFFGPGSTTDDTSPLLQGMVTSFNPGDSLYVIRDGMVLGAASVNSALGTWSYQDSGLVNGQTYNYMAYQASSAGIPLAFSTTAAITVNTSAPPPPPPPPPTSITIDHVMDNVAPVTGSVTNGMHTNDTMPVVSGSGAGPNSTVHVYDNGKQIGAATADGNGNWTYTPATANKLLDGDHSLTVTYIDTNGHESPSSSPVTFTVDTVPPTALAKISAIAEDTNLPNDFITSDNTLVVTVTVNGTLAADEKVRVSIDDGATWHEATLVNGNTYQYDATGTVLADGIHKFWAQVVDAAGNVSSSPGQAVEIDTVKPAALATISAITEDTGASATDFVTSDNTLVVTATVNGTVGFEEKVQISLDNGATWNDARMVSGSTYQFDATRTPLADGTYTFQARLTDLAGNTGQATSQTVIIDTTAPLALATISGIVTDTGMSATDFITSDNTLVVKATADRVVGSDERVQMSLDNGGTWHDATLAGGNTWQYDATGSALADGAYTFQTRVIDLAGNTSAAGKQTVVIDTRPPAPGKVMIDVIAGNDVVDQTEAGGSVTLTGTLTNIPTDAASQQVVVKVGSASHTAVINGTTWSVVVSGSELTANAASTAGHGSVVAELTLGDVAGNTTSVTESRGYMLHIEQPVTHVYSITTAKGGLGYSMNVIDDFNGDGYADYLVSAPGTRYDGGYVRTPAANYVLYGGPNGLPNLNNLDSITAAQGFKITSSYTGGHFTYTKVPGGTVTDIGDFNGDGLSDIAMVTPIDNSVYVIYGQRGMNSQTLDLARLQANQGFKVTAATGFLYSVAGLDVNGDGYSDLMFGDPTAGPKVQNVTSGMGGGAVYVVYGHAGTQSNIGMVANTASSGGTDGNSITLTGAGTMGTGYTVLTSVGAQNLGTVYNVGGNTYNFVGYTGLGAVINAVGDVNNDGYTDYVATAPGGSVWGSSAPGWAYLIFGGPNGVTKGSTVNMATLDNMAATGKGFKIDASNLYEFLGGKRDSGGPEGRQADGVYPQYHTVAGLGDIDGSGRSAFAIGSPGAITPSTGAQYGYPGLSSDGAGAVYVLYGDSANLSNVKLPAYNGSWSGGSLNGSNGFVIYSSSFAAKANGTVPNASDLGFSVSSAGDINGDGTDDFLIGAPMANNSKGAVFVVFGKAGGIPWATDAAGKSITGVVDLDQLVAAGKADVFGAPGTAIQYDGTFTNINSNYVQGVTTTSGGTGSNMGTDVTGGDFSGTGLHGYIFGAWGDSGQTGQVYSYDGISMLLTQPISNANNAVYYAGSGVDLIATGSGNNVWVHGIGTDTTGSASLTIQHDVVNGGRGDEHIGIIGTSFTSVNGGNGTDTLVFEGSGINLNLADMGLRVQGIEQFDLNNQTHNAASDPNDQFSGLTHGNTLELRLSDVMSQMGDAPNSQHMTILGDSTSMVQLDGSGWSTSSMQTVGGVTFDVYHNSTLASGNTVADLLIEHGVHVVTGGIAGAGAPLAAVSAASAPLAGISAASAPITDISATSAPHSQEDLPLSTVAFSNNVLSTHNGSAVTSDGSTVSTSADGNHTFTSGTSGDTFNIEQGYTDTLLYKLLDSADTTGGNGHDQVNGFTVGTWGTTPNADRIDLSNLLQGYKPATADTGNTVDSGKPADTGNTVDNSKPADSGATADTGSTVDSGKPAENSGLDQYLSVTHDNNSTTVNVDVHGTGQHAALVTLNNVDVSLETLLANNQIVV